MLSASKNAKATLILNTDQVKAIEKNNLLSLGEKLDLLAISLGFKLTSEIYQRILYVFDEKTKKEVPLPQTILALEQILKKLPFPYFLDKVEKRNRQSGRLKKFVWFQVCVNEKAAHFMRKYSEGLTEMELGILYGFPLSAIRAFSGLVERGSPKPSSSAEGLFMGVPSKEFRLEERNYYEKWWQSLRRLSPILTNEAEKLFAKERTFMKINENHN